MANKITTLGYTLKRLRDSGYISYALYKDYSMADSRAWTIVIDPKGASVFCTCYINDPYMGDTYLELHDGNRYIPGRLNIKTQSIEVLISHLVRFNIPTKYDRKDQDGTEAKEKETNQA